MNPRPLNSYRPQVRHAAAFFMGAICASPLAANPVASFDINDADVGPYTQLGWTPVSGAANDADTISGSDGTHTLTLTTTDDGQDRERNVGSFTTDSDLWRDFWFVTGSSAVATVSGLAPDTDYTVEIWAYDLWSAPSRSANWMDAVTGNSTTLAFEGGVTPVPASLSDSVAVVHARSNGSGVLTLLAANNGGLPGIYVNGLRVSEGGGSVLVEVEAESGDLGAGFGTGNIDGADYIGISTTSSDTGVPGSQDRVATYTVMFSDAATYNLYARIRVGPDAFNDDSFFYGNGFGSKSPTDPADWVPQVFTGLANTGFTGPEEVVTVGGGSASNNVWKWVRFDTAFVVGGGALTQTFQVGGRENGFLMDRFVFAPSELTLTVAELESGIIDPPVTFDGRDGIAIHRFGEPNGERTPDGANPAAGLALVGGELVGTTLAGGNTGDGVIFRVSLDGETFETMTSFIGTNHGAQPQGDFLVSGSTVIGASAGGGGHGTGGVFERAADGTVTLLHGFDALNENTASNAGGAVPRGPFASDGGTIFGAATAGGPYANGIVFSISGSGFAVLHEFNEIDSRYGTNSDGTQPGGGVILVGSRLFGTATAGGSGGSGTIFSMDPDGSDFQVLHHFSPLDSETAANADGAVPCGRMVERAGVLFGTTLCGGSGGSGTVFSIDTDGSDFLTLYQFSARDPLAGTNADGAQPSAGLSLSGNVLYGTTPAGGPGATGTVFALDPFVPDFRTFHGFQPLSEDGTNAYGAHPVAPPLRVAGALYGTAFSGGPGGSGSIYQIPIPLTLHPSATANPDDTIDSILTVRGAPDSPYLIQAKNDLSSPSAWQDVYSGNSDASGFVFLRKEALALPMRFYRVATGTPP